MMTSIREKIDAMILSAALIIAKRRNIVIVAIPPKITAAQRQRLALLITRSLQLNRQRSRSHQPTTTTLDQQMAGMDSQAEMVEMEKQAGTEGTRHLHLVRSE